MRRLWPDPLDPISVWEASEQPRVPTRAGRPWTMVCMVTSLDGATVVDGRSGGLSHPVDFEMLLALRARADVIVVGAGTVRAEGYGPPRRAGQRIAVVSRTGKIDTSSELFRSGAGFLILPEDAPAVDVAALRAGTGGRVDLERALSRLDADVVQVEGGASLNAAFAENDLIDELNVTISPLVAGGDSPRLVAGAPPLGHRLELAQLAEHDHFLFTRWLRATSRSSQTPEA